VLILIESETVPVKQKAMQSRASLIAGYDHTSTSFLHNHKSRKTSQTQSKKTTSYKPIMQQKLKTE